VDFLECT